MKFLTIFPTRMNFLSTFFELLVKFWPRANLGIFFSSKKFALFLKCALYFPPMEEIILTPDGSFK